MRKKPVKWIELTIPVQEGDRYRLGEVKFDGLTVFKEDAVRGLFKARQADVYDESRFTKAYDKLRDAYGAQGYFQWTAGTLRRPDPERKVVDVTVRWRRTSAEPVLALRGGTMVTGVSISRGFAVLALSVTLAGCANGLMTATEPAGYAGPVILFAPIADTSTYLMTPDGQKLHQWTGDFPPGYSVYLLPNGNLLRTNSIDRPLSSLQGTNGGRVEMLDWDSRVRWRFDYATAEGQQHHDVFYMPNNGHVLLVAWERRGEEEALAAGRRPGTFDDLHELWVDTIVEVDPATSRVVWEWRTWDHLVPPGERPQDHPGLIDLNYVNVEGADWTHANAVFYNAALDQVVLSVRNFHEVWVIDHSTTTAQAAGHTGGRLGRGGDLVYRWGNPEAYGLQAERQLWGQHNPSWIAPGLPGAGNMLVFDNGDRNARPYSTVVEITPPVEASGAYAFDPETGYGPEAPLFQYVADPPASFFAPIISGAQRLASGNTLVTDGPAGRFFEVTPGGQTVWSYTVRDTAGTSGYLVFRAARYEAGYAGLAGRTLRPEGELRIPVALPQAAGVRGNRY